MLKQIVDLIFTLMVLIGSIFLWRVADLFPSFEKYKNVDSDFWPKIILATMGVLAVMILFENISALRLQAKRKVKAPSGIQDDTTAPAVDRKKMALMGLICIAYYWGLSLCGFVLATIVFMWLAMAVIGGAKKITAIVYPVLFTGALAVIFVRFLELSLPRGVWLFHEFSLLLY